MVAKPMLSRSWWMLALRGVLALLFGVLALLLPGPTVLSLVLLFAAYALLAGIVYLVGAVRNRRHATGSHAAGRRRRFADRSREGGNAAEGRRGPGRSPQRSPCRRAAHDAGRSALNRFVERYVPTRWPGYDYNKGPS